MSNKQVSIVGNEQLKAKKTDYASFSPPIGITSMAHGHTDQHDADEKHFPTHSVSGMKLLANWHRAIWSVEQSFDFE